MSLDEKRLFLLDMDGTIYLGGRLFDGTINFLSYIRNIGGRYLFLTNNSSKSVSNYVGKLVGMGIDASKYDFLTSAQATAYYLKEKYDTKKIYVLGTEAFKSELCGSGLNITDSLDNDIVCLCMGFDTELTFQKLEDTCILLGRGVDYIATNPDLVCPTEYGYVPDCGSVSIMLKNSTGREPLFIGKPKPEMIYTALQKTGFSKEQTIMVGDRLYTDIACGIAAGVDTALVLSGETKSQDLTYSPHMPTFVFEDIAGMLKKLSGIK